MRWPGLVLVLVSGCSLLVQFDPESQPCDSAGACLSGYACSDAGLCKATDAGDITPADAGGMDASTCAVRETSCTDGRDNDCDGLIDCRDGDCGGQGCDDGNACTTGETCSGTTCLPGTAVVCNTPPNADCQSRMGTCEPGTGRCLYPALANGYQCGVAASSRCCGGTCIDTSINNANCGGCGLACAVGQNCQPLERSNCTSGAEPAATSGRCTCAAGVLCPSGQVCNTSCKPVAPTQCAPGQVLGGNDGGFCGTYCRY